MSQITQLGAFGGGGTAITWVETPSDRFTMEHNHGYVVNFVGKDGGWVLRTAISPALVGTIIAYDVAYHDGLWVAVSDNGTPLNPSYIFTSTDTINWTSHPQTTWGGNGIWSITYDEINSLWVAGGNTQVATSHDGIVWTVRPTTFSASIRGISSDQSALIVAVGDGGEIETSPDCITWASRVSGVATNLRDVAYDGSQWAVCGFAGVILTSPDGITWTSRTSSFGATDINSICYGGGLWVAVGAGGGKIGTSPDGITWTQRAAFTANQLFSVAYGQDGFKAGAGAGGELGWSADGITWALELGAPFLGADIVQGIAYGYGNWVAVGGAYTTPRLIASILYNPIDLALPATATIGDIFRIGGEAPTKWTATQNAGQTIHFGILDTTAGATGSLLSTMPYDAIELVCTQTNTDFAVLSSIGNITVI